MALTPVSTLSDVIRFVIALLVAVGEVRDPDTNPNGVEILQGELYLQQEGAPPRIVFVQSAGSLGPVFAVGAEEVATITASVRCYVWGAETSDDVSRYDAAYALCHRLINAFKASAPGVLKGGTLTRGDATNIETFGEEYQLAYSYTWPVPVDDDIWAAAREAAPDPALSPGDPDKPTGDTGLTLAIGTTTFTNERP